MKTLILFLTAVVLRANCLPVNGDRILAGDLAGLIPEFAGIAAESIGLAPQPTVRRVMSGGELIRIARKFGLSISAPMDVCFESPVEVLTRAQVLEQIEAGLNMEGVEIDLVEFSRYPVPVGVLSFPKSGLNVHPLLTEKSVVFWRGKVAYAGTRSFSVWARVRLGADRQRLIAVEAIRVGSVLTEEQVRMEQVKQFPFDADAPIAAGAAVGRVARRTIAAGQVLTASALASPKEVLRGAEVAVLVKSNGAQLSLAARAESSGGVGETVSLKNPVNGHTFRAVVNGKNRAMVIAK